MVGKLGASCASSSSAWADSFQLLTHVDAGYLKIDQGLIGELGKNAKTRRVRDIADRAKR